jgi:hypothetical protein
MLQFWAKQMESCNNYKNSRTFDEVNVTLKLQGLGGIHLEHHEMTLGFFFWHFQVEQSGSFVSKVHRFPSQHFINCS